MDGKKIIFVSLLLSLFACGCIASKTSSKSKAKSKESRADLNQSGNLAPPIGQIKNESTIGCPENIADETEYCQTFHQKAGETGAASSAIDILWVIENSGNIMHMPATVAKNFETFIDKFSSQALNTDFQMAVISTDSLKPAVNRDSEGKLTSSELKKNRQAFIDLFVDKVTFEADETVVRDDEAGLAKSLEFLQTSPPWSRPNAYLIIVYVTDEDDHSCPTGYTSWTGAAATCPTQGFIETESAAQEVVDYYFEPIIKMKGDSPGLIKVFAIVNQPGNTFPNYLSVGVRYNRAVQTFGGKSYNIIHSFDDILKDFGQKVAELASQFQLKYPAQEGSIEVTVDGTPIPRGNWQYLAADNAIRFEKNALPKAGSTIKITYQTR